MKTIDMLTERDVLTVISKSNAVFDTISLILMKNSTCLCNLYQVNGCSVIHVFTMRKGKLRKR